LEVFRADFARIFSRGFCAGSFAPILHRFFAQILRRGKICCEMKMPGSMAKNGKQMTADGRLKHFTPAIERIAPLRGRQGFRSWHRMKMSLQQ
jgi:hypothetical protein